MIQVGIRESFDRRRYLRPCVASEFDRVIAFDAGVLEGFDEREGECREHDVLAAADGRLY